MHNIYAVSNALPVHVVCKLQWILYACALCEFLHTTDNNLSHQWRSGEFVARINYHIAMYVVCLFNSAWRNIRMTFYTWVSVIYASWRKERHDTNLCYICYDTHFNRIRHGDLPYAWILWTHTHGRHAHVHNAIYTSHFDLWPHGTLHKWSQYIIHVAKYQSTKEIIASVQYCHFDFSK